MECDDNDDDLRGFERYFLLAHFRILTKNCHKHFQILMDASLSCSEEFQVEVQHPHKNIEIFHHNSQRKEKLRHSLKVDS